jgi:hypothetical protein
MKIAVCVSGQPRNVQLGISNLLSNLDCEVDVFVHSWWDSSSDSIIFSNSGGHPVTSNITNDWIGDLYGMVDVKSILVNSQKKFSTDDIITQSLMPAVSHFTLQSMFYSIFMCNTLKCAYEKDNGFKYDWVIRTRFDFGFEHIIDFNKFDMTNIYVPNDNPHPFGYNDQFAIGSSNNMDVYSNVYKNMNDIFNYGSVFVGKYSGEQFLAKWLAMNDIAHTELNLNCYRYGANHA